jgi:flavin-dependent dehydrogenase
MYYDVVIIGAGPAGLAAATKIDLVSKRYLIIDAGKTLEDRDRYTILLFFD